MRPHLTPAKTRAQKLPTTKEWHALSLQRACDLEWIERIGTWEAIFLHLPINCRFTSLATPFASSERATRTLTLNRYPRLRP